MRIRRLYRNIFFAVILLTACQSSVSDQKVQEKIQKLTEYFGDKNLRKDLGQKTFYDRDSIAYVKFVKVRITHIPTGKMATGENSDNLSYNTLEALVLLKEQVKNSKDEKQIDNRLNNYYTYRYFSLLSPVPRKQVNYPKPKYYRIVQRYLKQHSPKVNL